MTNLFVQVDLKKNRVDLIVLERSTLILGLENWTRTKTKTKKEDVRLQIPLFSEQDNFLLKRGLRIIF